MKRDNFTLITTFVTLSMLVTTGYLVFNGNFAKSAGASAVIVIIAMGAAHYFSRKGLEYNINPVGWLLAAPLFFALVGFGVWAGCVGGAYLLNSIVKAAPTVDFLELVSGIMSRGLAYAQIGLLIGAAWAIPTSLLMFLFRKASGQTKETQTLRERAFNSELRQHVA